MLVSGSLVLLADAGRIPTDAWAPAGSLWAIRLAARPAQRSWTSGFQRGQILPAATLLSTCRKRLCPRPREHHTV